MTPLKPTTVYVPVKKNQGEFIVCIQDLRDLVPLSSNGDVVEKQGYFLTKEELTSILGEAWDRAKIFALDESYSQERGTMITTQNKDEYISSLIK